MGAQATIYYAEEPRAEMSACAGLGDEVWFYTCCQAGRPLSATASSTCRFMRTRMLFWGNYKYDLTGYLHWGLNHWNIRAAEPVRGYLCQRAARIRAGLSGDTHIVYPLGGGAIGSMRAEMTRGGTEDYELLRHLSQTQPERAKAICDRMIRAFVRLRQLRRRLRRGARRTGNER